MKGCGNMKRTKRTLSFLAAAALLLMLCACAGDKTDPQPTETATAAATTVETTTVSETTAPATEATDLLTKMTLEEKVGQMFFVRCPDVGAAQWITQYHPGGFVLFGRDFEDKSANDVINTIHGYQTASSVPMLIGVDEEGGTVVRVSAEPKLRSKPFLSPKDTYAAGGWDAVTQTESEKAELLLSLGINVNLAPVCDVTSNPDSFMFDRSFSGDTQEVSRFVTDAVTAYRKQGLGCVLKHFPGYGDNTDTHEDMSYDDKPYEEFVTNDFPPFSTGVDAGAGCVMVAHTIMACQDAEHPASLSEAVHKVLRDELHFDGVIMTDDLAMDAIAKYTGADEAAVAAVKCGNDLLCCTDVATQVPAVLKAVQSGEISEEQINASVKRILRWKEHLGLIK